MRHGSRIPGDPLSSYRFNAVFFDGYAETLDGQAGSDPILWLPKGTTIGSGEFSAEAKLIYFNGSPGR